MNLKLTILLCPLVLSAAAFGDGLVDGSADAGKAKSATCSACHGADGNSVNPMWPSLAGQHAPYIVKQLTAFKSGDRVNALMSGQAMALSEQDMRDLAAYYARQRRAAKAVANEATLDKGRALYRGGDKESSASACMACHGPTGTGNPAAAYPSLRGQYAAYTAKQLRDYASGERKTDAPTKVMREIAVRLAADDIDAVSSYIQGLHGQATAAE